MINDIKKTYDDFKANFDDKPEYTIDFYSKNSSFLSKIQKFQDKEELRLFIEIVWQNLHAIFSKDRFNETIDFADKNLNIIDRELIRLDADDLKDDWYNGILHFKGMASYRLRDYKTATPIYKYLTKTDPKNDSFENWLKYSSYGQKLWLVKTINVSCGLLMVIYFFSKEYIEFFAIRISILTIGLIGLVGNWCYEYYIQRSFRRTTKQ